jgi:cyanophycinase
MTVPIKVDFPYSGILALAGSGEYLPDMDPVDRALISRLAEPARVICLPTAAGTEGPERMDYWMKLGEQHFRSLNVESVRSLPVISREDAQNPDFVHQVRDSNFIYMSGGKPFYLLECLIGTDLLEAMLTVLKNGGIVAGCSAGAMIFGERIPNRSFIGGTSPAIGLLPGYFVVPHYDEVPFILRFAAPHLTGNLRLLGIEANTVLACSREVYMVIGSGGVTLADGSEAKRYLAGE